MVVEQIRDETPLTEQEEVVAQFSPALQAVVNILRDQGFDLSCYFDVAPSRFGLPSPCIVEAGIVDADGKRIPALILSQTPETGSDITVKPVPWFRTLSKSKKSGS